MDVGEYGTNTLLINNIYSVTFKIYELVGPQLPVTSAAAADVESELRRGGHLVCADSMRRAMWCFNLTDKDGFSLGGPAEPKLGAAIEMCGHRLVLVEEGGFEPIGLVRSRPTAAPIHTPSSSSSSASALDAGMRSAPSGILSSALPSGGNILDSDIRTTATIPPEPKIHGTMPAKDVYQYFITAILASLLSKFCAKTGAIPLNSRTFILPSITAQEAHKEGILTTSPAKIGSLRIYLTSTGFLLISISLTLAEGLGAAFDGTAPMLPSPGITVLAAPLGMFGTIQILIDAEHCSTDGSVIQSPDAHLSRLRLELDGKYALWRKTCSKMLEMRGISSAKLKNSPWLNVHCLRRKATESKTDGKLTPVGHPFASILWPAVLCFRKRTRSACTINRTGDPSVTSFKDGVDPLSDAKIWFKGSGERDDLLAKRKKEREAAMSKDASEGELRPPQNNDYSPVVLRRTSNSGAATGVMYPTPPDGVQNPVGATPSGDALTSSPGNPATTIALDVDTIMAPPGLGDMLGGWDNTDAKREQTFIQEENLFGDLGEDVFGDTDITDADFSFFDEQPATIDIGLPDLPGATAPGPSTTGANHAIETPSQKPADGSNSQMGGVLAPPVFAKPELRHARSSLIDENRQRDPAKSRPSGGVKRQSSPFDPNTVYKRIKASLEVKRQSRSSPTRTRRGSVFETVDLGPSLSLVNKKYQDSGRFDCHWDPQKENKSFQQENREPPTTDYLRRHGKGRARLKDLPSNLGAQIARITGALENSSLQQSPTKSDDSTSEADEVSLVSDQDDVSEFSDEPSSPTKSSGLRRRADEDGESVAPSFVELDVAEESPAYSTVELYRLPNTDGQEVSTAEYFSDLEPAPPQQTYADDDFITIAQIVTEQAVSGSLKYDFSSSAAGMSTPSERRRELMNDVRTSVQALRTILPPCLRNATECQFRPLIEVQDVPLLGPPNRLQPRPPGGPEQRPSLFQIPAPHLELRRHETRLSVLPSALSFWESLGLGPSQGPKNVHSVCVFPDLEGMADNASIFLDRLRSVYESLKLGSFDRMATGTSIQNGLVPFEVEKTTNSPAATGSCSFSSFLISMMAKLAHAISYLPDTSQNFVIYFVYTPGTPDAIVQSCAAFQRLFEMYKRKLSDLKKPAENELALQLVSIDLIASSTSLAVLSPSEYVQLCLETYDRCTLFGGPMPAPAIILEQPLQRGIDFQLRNPPSTNILHENSCIHIAYAQSLDERWITAAWTDNRGFKQMTASYCRGRRGKPLTTYTPLTDVLREIWETTYDMISIWKVHWRVIITKCAPMDQQEIDFWVTLAQAGSKALTSLTLLTVDTNPSMQLVPPAGSIPMTAPSAFYTTPVSTPQSSMVSPEQVGNPPTPMGAPSSMSATTPGADNNATESDADASLVDVTDTTWGAVVSHRFNNSPSLVEQNPALVSGFLVKWGGTRAEDPPVAMEVNIVHSEGNPRLYDLVLREMLTQFRGLGTIARARSMVDKETDVRPWHVAAAEKGVKALHQLM